MAATNQVSILEHFQAEPSPDSVSELFVSLTFSDMMWIAFISPIQRLIFYELPVSKIHFVDVIVPKLKTSLSRALRHFPALAGNLIIAPDGSRPEIRYTNGDSVRLVFAESNHRDFEDLISDEPRNCGRFQPCVPKLPQFSESSGTIKVPLLALQVTLFPGIGICIGLSNQHVVADGSSMYAFTRAWTMLCKLDDEGISSLDNKYLPSYDREVMKDTEELGEIVWKFVKTRVESGSKVFEIAQFLPADTDKLRGTFIVTREHIQKLKHYVSTQRPAMQHLSTFTVVSAYVWTCMVKSGNAITEATDEDEPEYFGFVADCRGRNNPPIPENYFGNCLSYILATGKNGELITEEGVAVAAELIGKAIQGRLKSNDGPFKALKTMFSEFSKIKMERVLSIAGSPRQNYYEMDFGWGKPRKFEFISIDMTGAFSLTGSRESGDLEIGLSLPKGKMDAFARFFKEGPNVL